MPLRALALLGRHATGFMAGGVLLGLAVPPLASLAKPLLVPTLLIPLTLALVRLDWRAAAKWRHRTWIVAALLLWLLGASPLLAWVATQALLRWVFPRPCRWRSC